MDERLKAITGALAIGVAVIGAFVALGLAVAAERQPFSAAEWAAGVGSHDAGWRASRRRRMANELLARRQLDGLTRKEVEAILGASDQTAHWPDWHLRYDLGTAGYVQPLDSAWLVVRFGPDGRIAEYRVVVD